jgi:cell wall-associated NlpC family hydrolase
LFFSYGCDDTNFTSNPPYPDRYGIYEHVAVYIGNGDYIDVITKGCSVNSSVSATDNGHMNLNYWSYGAVKDMIREARRLIQPDGSIKLF